MLCTFMNQAYEKAENLCAHLTITHISHVVTTWVAGTQYDNEARSKKLPKQKSKGNIPPSVYKWRASTSSLNNAAAKFLKTHGGHAEKDLL